MEKWFSGGYCPMFKKTVFVAVCLHITTTKSTVLYTLSQWCHVVKYKNKCKNLHSVIRNVYLCMFPFDKVCCRFVSAFFKCDYYMFMISKASQRASTAFPTIHLSTLQSLQEWGLYSFSHDAPVVHSISAFPE